MRYPALPLVFLTASIGSISTAQVLDFNDLVTLRDPQLSVTITKLDSASFSPLCDAPYKPGCLNKGTLGDLLGTDSAGQSYFITKPQSITFPCDVYTYFGIIWRPTGHWDDDVIAFVNVSFPTSPGYNDLIQVSQPSLDFVQGTITMLAVGTVLHNCQAGQVEYAKVTISGLPKLFDTLLTFVPGGQSLTALVPGLPDGFRSADTVQAWTGNVRTLPDWSRASPLACHAATSPLPGQTVTVSDTLPDPALGEGRYYVLASQSGSSRRLGRQYVNGALSPRDPATLPECPP